VQARIGHLQGRLSELSKIDVKAMPYDRVGFGSRVKVRDHFMDEVVEFSIVAGDYMDLDGGQVSIASPIGRGLLGAEEGQDVVISLPVGDRTFTVVELTTLPQQIGLSREEAEG
jgi:transcription elongation factor GreA